ncbi:DUF5615 family PIN-like protein [Rathayibacter sp. VKM Ac-2754]|uniref:PIN-like domain-containing protein n=1 Tax=Rathayibacter sp. VKM Ac-2754 TaxID=2609251 RepID=UPI001359CD40|nr:DUF5615 family PIN-like protein [Rathayibacter sp. VKM Ac-2754]MWV59337.1 hypothetical protein [Rathayibacter sp. VKM Ac-2754]
MPAPRLLLDRSLGQRKLVARLREAGWDVTTLAEYFGDERAQSMPDEEWIGEGTRAGFVLLAKDHMIAARPLEARAVYLHDARVITLARGDLTAEQMGDLCLEHAAAIDRIAKVRPPFVFSLSPSGLRRKRLNWPAD